MTNHSEITEYNSLNDIRLKKEAIRKEIDADDAKIQTLWNSLFTKPQYLVNLKSNTMKNTHANIEIIYDTCKFFSAKDLSFNIF